jgi:protein-S-isoprenylcysteine O-methyltransferase Ste14
MPDRAPWYRGTRGEWYVVAQVILFALIALGPRSIPGLPEPPAALASGLAVLGVALMLAGAALAVGGVLRLGSNLSVLPYPRDCAELVESGAYSIVRNPIYSGLVIGAFGWAAWLHAPLTAAFALALFLLFDAKSRLEERWLAEKFGEPYREYRARVKRLIPWLY